METAMPGSSSWVPYAPQGVKGFNQVRSDNNIYQKHRYTCLLLLSVLAVPEHLSNINLSGFAFFYWCWILQNQTTNVCTVYMPKPIHGGGLQT